MRYDYDVHGGGYAAVRQPDVRIARSIEVALASARTVVNVGAGTGSYEPSDRYVLAVEPSRVMRAQRPATSPPAIDARAEALPLDDDSVDAAMAILTVHHWEDPVAGLRELRRVARDRVVVLTVDPDALARTWLAEYLPELPRLERELGAAPGDILRTLGGGNVRTVPIPADCSDGFLMAYMARPEAYLDPSIRRAQSGWGRLEPRVVARLVAQLAADLASGEWDRRHGALRTEASYDAGLRLVIA